MPKATNNEVSEATMTAVNAIQDAALAKAIAEARSPRELAIAVNAKAEAEAGNEKTKENNERKATIAAGILAGEVVAEEAREKAVKVVIK